MNRVVTQFRRRVIYGQYPVRNLDLHHLATQECDILERQRPRFGSVRVCRRGRGARCGVDRWCQVPLHQTLIPHNHPSTQRAEMITDEEQGIFLGIRDTWRTVETE